MVCSSQVSDIWSQQNCPDTSAAMALTNPLLTFALHCHLNARLPTTKRVGRQLRTAVPVDEESPQSGHGHRGSQSHGVRPLAGSRALVRKFLPRDSELGDELVDMPGRGGTHRHNSLQGSPLAHCAVQDSGGGAPHWQQTQRRQGPHGAWCSQEYKPAVGYSSQLTKGIMVISKYFWSLYKLSLLWWHFLSWNLEPKALSSWSAEDSQIAKYLVMD